MTSLLLLSLLCVLGADASANTIQRVDAMPFLRRPTATTERHFLSFTLDWNQNETVWDHADITRIDLTDDRFAIWVRSLAPSILRIGGGLADFATYDVGDVEYCAPHLCLTMDRWVEINQFCVENGCKVVFDLNLGYGRCTGARSPKSSHMFYCTNDAPLKPWDPSNAFALLQFTKEHNIDVFGFELGNEKTYVIEPEEMAADYRTLHNEMRRLWPDPNSRPKLFGPAMNIQSDWLTEFLDVLGPDVLDVVTYHIYIGYGLSSTVQDFITKPAFLDRTLKAAVSTFRAVGQSKNWNPRKQQLWLGEGAAAWHSGRHGVCDSVYSSFWYIDTLGTLAATGHGAHCRQAIAGGQYRLLDQNNGFRPNPDAWTALYWKTLMGRKALSILQLIPSEHDFAMNLRLYMHCHPAEDGSVTMAYANLDPTTVANVSMYLQINVTVPGDFETHRMYEIRSMEPGVQGLASDSVQLNGKELTMDWDAVSPLKSSRVPMPPAPPIQNEYPHLAPLSFGFVVFPNANVKACKRDNADLPEWAVED